MKKVLVITYQFPPVGGGGVQRPLKFVKYLPQFGWKPYVLTVKRPKAGVLDYSLEKDIPAEAEVIRTYCPLDLSHNKLVRKGVKGFNINEKYSNNKILYKLKNVLYPILRSLYLSIASTKINWIPFVFSNGLKFIREQKIDVIFITAPPFYPLLAAVLLKKVTQKPLVTDFRDPWTETNMNNKLYKRLKVKLETFLRNIVISNSNKVIDVSKPISDNTKDTFPQINSARFVIIPNGFDSEDIASLRTQTVKSKNTKMLKITHIGTLCGRWGRIPESFFKALNNLSIYHKEIYENIKVIFVGKVFLDVVQRIKKYNLEDKITLTGYVSHSEAINFGRQTDLLLLYQERMLPGIYTGKIFEYINYEKKILALVPPDDVAANLIRESRTGVVIHPNDADGTLSAILEMYQKHQNNELTVSPNWEVINKFNRVELTKKLAGILDDIS